MKKIMLAAAIICVAAVSQGASVMWTASATAANNGQTMYLLTSIASSYDSVEAFTDSAVGSVTVKKVGPVYRTDQVTSADDAITKSGNFYLAVLSADQKTVTYLDVTEGMKEYVFTPPDSAPGTFSVAFSAVAGSATSVAVVPEPTSGLLMLVGLGALALRRRRA